MNKNADSVTLSELKIGKLVTLNSPKNCIYDIYTGGYIDAVEYSYYGSVLGLIRDNKFIDLITKKEFSLIERDNRHQPLLDKVKKDSLYVVFVYPANHLFDYNEYNLDQKINSIHLNNIINRLRNRKTPHITDKEYMNTLEKKFPEQFPKEKNIIKAYKSLKETVLAFYDCMCVSAEFTFSRPNEKDSKDSNYQKKIHTK